MFEPLGDLLPKNIRKAGLEDKLRSSAVVQVAREVLAEIFGGDGRMFDVKSFKGGVLKVVCRSSVYAQEAHLREREIAAAINRRLGDDIVSRIQATG